jgi:hypothetical protein
MGDSPLTHTHFHAALSSRKPYPYPRCTTLHATPGTELQAMIFPPTGVCSTACRTTLQFIALHSTTYTCTVNYGTTLQYTPHPAQRWRLWSGNPPVSAALTGRARARSRRRGFSFAFTGGGTVSPQRSAVALPGGREWRVAHEDHKG